jgi:hypothetical protein
MATIEEILANVNARGYDSNQNTANTNFGIGSSRGVNQNYANLYNVKPPIQNTPVEDTLMNYNEHYTMPPQQNTGGLINFLKTQGSKFKDFAMPAVKDVASRTIASQALGNAGGMIFGLPGALAGTIFGGLQGNLFDQPYIGGVTTVDEFGNLISAEELDKQNALGGYYTDAARASRRRDKSIAAYKARDAVVKGRYKQLLDQQKLERDTRQAEAKALQDANRATAGTDQATGGYQSSFASDSDFMEGDPNAGGRGTTATMGSFKYGGIVGMYR